MSRAPHEPLLQGDITPRLTDNADLRNDTAGGALDQAKNIILRYLETAPSDDFVDYTQMVEDITRHWPFIGDSGKDFRDALEALKSDGLLVAVGDQLQINKTAHVAHNWLLRVVQRSR